MFKQILVPLDGSTRAERALPVAVRLAESNNGSIVLLRVVSTATEWWPASLEMPSHARIVVASELEEAQSYLSGLATSPDVRQCVGNCLVVFGPAVSTILAVAKTHHCDSMVLCAHDHQQFPYWMSGSVVKEVIRHTSLPTLVLREYGLCSPDRSGESVHPLRALVALDGGKGISATLRSAAACVRGLAPVGGTLHALHVMQPPAQQRLQSGESRLALRGLWNDLRTAGEDLVSACSRAAESALLPVQVHASVAAGPDVAETIVSIAEHGACQDEPERGNEYDMIVLMKHPCSRMQYWSLGSVLERVLGLTNLPVLILPSEEQSQKYHLHETVAPYDTLQVAYSEA